MDEDAMTVPLHYKTASEDFDAFLRDVMAVSGLTTRNQAFTMSEAVLRAFRARLAVEDALRFADVLPVGLRALFVSGWRPAPPKPWGMTADWIRDVKALRPDHNMSTETAISDVAAALRLHVDQAAFARLLADLPPLARHFWQP